MLGDEPLTFDPFASEADWTPKPKATLVRDKYRPSIVDRASKRTVRVVGDRKYRVSKLDRELLEYYDVWFESGKWECACYSMDHGDTRRRTRCSHVVAVLLFREAEHTPPRLNLNIPRGVVQEGSETRIATVLPVDRERSTPPVPTDKLWGDTPLPFWVQEIYPHQWQAVEEAVEYYNSGIDIVYLDAPTGSGKTLIAELIRRRLEQSALYVCSTKTLQDQFVRDFDYAKVLKGRGNYPTLNMPYPEYTAGDCTKTGTGDDARCYWCSDVKSCPYEMAKSEALRSRLAVLNTSYLLTEGNNVGRFSGRELVIADEADVLESELMGFVTYELSERRLERLGLSAPKKGVRKTTILGWLSDELLPRLVQRVQSLPVNGDIRTIRERNGLVRLVEDTRRVIVDLTQEIETVSDEDNPGVENWIRDNDAGPLVLKPVRVDQYAGRFLWCHGKRWLCMSATFVSTEEMNDSLGIDVAGLKTATVKVPMLFAKENREIVSVPVANMTNKEKETEWPKMIRAIDNVCSWYPEDRILVHTVSYAFTEYLMKNCSRELRLRSVTYRNGQERDNALARYRQNKGSVLLAPSMDRGIDLKDNDCRVVIVAKVPFPNLGDRQVGSRLRGVGGQTWYNVATIRKLVQMTGRGVRSKDDWCRIYILDAQFMRKIWKVKQLLPGWWREAVTVGQVHDYL